jgi:hypothetical protein
MERPEVEQLLRDGLRRLLSEDYELFEGRAHERTITTRLAAYLEANPQIPAGLSVDHEYNRMEFVYVKMLEDWVGDEIKRDSEGRIVDSARVPDILIHGRGDNDSNLLAIEVKVEKQNSYEDMSKIWSLTAGRLAYKFGVLLSVLEEHEPSGPVWVAMWVWNPEPGNEAIDYQLVFDHEESVVLADLGRQNKLHRIRLRRSSSTPQSRSRS